MKLVGFQGQRPPLGDTWEAFLAGLVLTEEIKGVKCYRPSPKSPVAFVVFPNGQVVQSMDVSRSLMDDVKELGPEGAYNRLVRSFKRSRKG